MQPRLKSLATNRWVQTFIVLALLSGICYQLFFTSITITPQTEAKQMEQLTVTKQVHSLDPFVSDGCSGGVSTGWVEAMKQLQQLPTSLSEQYADLASIPFEEACVTHDRAYHSGDGGYTGRLKADNELRSAIIQHGITNAEEIAARNKLNTTEQAIYLYEVIAEAVYRAVRLGGAPCTGQAYAWGYGYGGGQCDEVQ